MKISITDTAKQNIIKQLGKDRITLKLVYDAEGCGCAVSGVPQLWIIEQAGSEDILMEGTDDSLSIVYERRHEVFFEDELKLDYNPSRSAYTLSSSQQIYSNGIRLKDQRVLI